MLQGPEILVILLVALVVFGPERLPEMARKLGRWTNELRVAAREVRAGLQAEVEAVKDVTGDITAPLDEAKSAIADAAAPLADAKDALDSVTKPQRWVGPKPQSGPGPEEAMKDLEAIEAAAGEGSGDAEPDGATDSLLGEGDPAPGNHGDDGSAAE